MQNDSYMLDKKRDQAFSDPSEAAAWYEARLTEAQSALRDLMEVLPHLVRLAGMPDISEQPWLDRAQGYIDIYEGRTYDTDP